MSANIQKTDNIAGSLSEAVLLRGDAAGVIEAKNGKTLSFAELEKRSDQYAWYLKKSGVKPGDRVMLMVKPSADFICLTFALFKLGSPVILIDPGMGYKNLLRCVSGVEPLIFIGIAKAHFFLSLFKKHFSSLKLKFCLGNSLGIFGPDLNNATLFEVEKYPVYQPTKDDLAAIIFTTGSTGPPKGVRYEHSIFAAQLQHIKNYYGIGTGDIDQPAFPLFALFSTALGACAVIPDMDSTRPARVNPEKFVKSLMQHQVTYSFASPALWNVVSTYCLSRNIKLPNLKKVLMAGAPVSGELLQRVQKILPTEAEVHIPYGATESLPIVSIEAEEVVGETWHQTRQGRGTCVGRPLPGIDIRIIRLSDDIITEVKEGMILGAEEIGEIMVSGDVVTRAYDNNDAETRMAKTRCNDLFWHRMGDTGFLDAKGRLWFCGRKGHRVKTRNGIKYTIQCEAIVNNHPDIFRSALVGVGEGEEKLPVLVLEKEKSSKRSDDEILKEVVNLAGESVLVCDIEHYLFHDSFPVDIRHNAKIFREKLAVWAENKLAGRK